MPGGRARQHRARTLSVMRSGASRSGLRNTPRPLRSISRGSRLPYTCGQSVVRSGLYVHPRYTAKPGPAQHQRGERGPALPLLQRLVSRCPPSAALRGIDQGWLRGFHLRERSHLTIGSLRGSRDALRLPPKRLCIERRCRMGVRGAISERRTLLQHLMGQSSFSAGCRASWVCIGGR